MNDIITITRPHNKIIIDNSINDVVIPHKEIVLNTIIANLNNFTADDNVIKFKLVGELSNDTGRLYDYIVIKQYFKSNEKSLDLSELIDETLFSHPHMTRILTFPYFEGDRK